MSFVPSTTRPVAIAAGVVVVLVAIVAVLLGARVATGLTVGILLLVMFFLGGRIPVVLAPDFLPALSFMLLGLGYVLRIVLLLIALIRLRNADWLDVHALGGTLIVGALLWNAVLVWRHLNPKQSAADAVPTIDAEGVPR